MGIPEINPDSDTEPGVTSLWKLVLGDQYAVKTTSVSKTWDPETGTYITTIKEN